MHVDVVLKIHKESMHLRCSILFLIFYQTICILGKPIQTDSIPIVFFTGGPSQTAGINSNNFFKCSVGKSLNVQTKRTTLTGVLTVLINGVVAGSDCKIHDHIAMLTPINCTYAYSEKNLTLYWRNELAIPELDGSWCCKYEENVNCANLTIKDVAAVFKITSNLKNPMSIGSSVRFICFAICTKASETAKFTWTHNALSGGKTTEGHRVGTCSSVFLIYSLKASDQGSIECRVGSTTTTMKIEVKEPVGGKLDDLLAGCSTCIFFEQCNLYRCPSLKDGEQVIFPVGCVARCPRPTGVLECKTVNRKTKWFPFNPCFQSSHPDLNEEQTVRVNKKGVRGTILLASGIFIALFGSATILLFFPSVSSKVLALLSIFAFWKLCQKKKPEESDFEGEERGYYDEDGEWEDGGYGEEEEGKSVSKSFMQTYLPCLSSPEKPPAVQEPVQYEYDEDGNEIGIKKSNVPPVEENKSMCPCFGGKKTEVENKIQEEEEEEVVVEDDGLILDEEDD